MTELSESKFSSTDLSTGANCSSNHSKKLLVYFDELLHLNDQSVDNQIIANQHLPLSINSILHQS